MTECDKLRSEMAQNYLNGLNEGAQCVLAGIWGRVLAEGDNPAQQAYLIGLHEDLRKWHRATTPLHITQVDD